MRRLAAAALALLLAAPALAMEVAGVAVPETTTLAGKSLVLNGAGLRSKMFIKVYVGALYLEQKSGDASAILAADAPWKVSMTFKREVDKKKILETFREGFENNSSAQLPQILPGLAKFDAALADLKSGHELVIAYVPGTGATLTAPGGATATVEGKPFADALLRNWLGEKPADGDLKKAMLGK
jgi:hypothetical protein